MTMTSSPQGPLIQIAVLDELIGGDPELRKDFLGDYRSLLEEVVASVEAAVAAGAWSTVRAAAHKLKSSSFSLGVGAMGAHCKHLESLDPASQAAEAAEGIRRFHELATLVRVELQAYLDD